MGGGEWEGGWWGEREEWLGAGERGGHWEMVIGMGMRGRGW